MSEFDLNLSTRPFPAYGLTNVLLAAVLVILAIITTWQAYGFMTYTSQAAEIRDQERTARVESEVLGRRLAELEGELNTPEAAAKLDEIGYLNDLIARKTFSWTQVFANLENLVPDNVHLTALTPEIGPAGPVVMRINVRGRNVDGISNFISALEKSPAFENVVVSTEEKRDQAVSPDVDVALTVDYFPERENR
jgi:type IV pilus assembly protein PilN